MVEENYKTYQARAVGHIIYKLLGNISKKKKLFVVECKITSF